MSKYQNNINKSWYANIEKKAVYMNDNVKVKCECGHTVNVYYDKRPCKYCGRLVFKRKRDEFIYKLNQKLLNNK